MKFAAIVIALGIVLIVTMRPAPASAYAIVIRECGDDYVVTRYNQDGTVKGVWNKQLSDEGTIYTAGKTWTLVEGSPDRFVSDGGAQLQVVACNAGQGSGVRGLGGVQQDGAQAAQSSTTLVSNVGQPNIPSFGHLPLSTDNAQSFTTGIQDTTLTRVDMYMRVTQNQQASFAVEIWSGDSVPSTKVGTLGGRSSLFSSWTREEFAASGNGIDLAANTKYWVVIHMSKSSSAAHVRGTASTGEDPGAAAGWSIGSERRVRTNDSFAWDTVTNNPHSLKINVVGYALTPVRVTDAGEAILVKAFSGDRSTLRDYFTSECTDLRSVSDPYGDSSMFDADGNRLLARNGWKWVYAQNSQGDVTGTRPMTISECVSNKLYERQSFCAQNAIHNRQGDQLGHTCPDPRNW